MKYDKNKQPNKLPLVDVGDKINPATMNTRIKNILHQRVTLSIIRYLQSNQSTNNKITCFISILQKKRSTNNKNKHTRNPCCSDYY